MTKASKTSRVGTRRAILEILKQKGPHDASSLARQLRMSAMAVRQHLYALGEGKLVTYEEDPRPMGRPAKMWRLTPAADEIFPDAHAELTVSLIAAMSEAFGEEGLNKLLKVRQASQVAQYGSRISKDLSLQDRVKALAQLRTEEGYMAEVLRQEDGSLLLVENHCPICAAATVCQGLCAAELETFHQVLGKNIEIDRTDHIVQGARRCAYRIAETDGR